MLIKNISSSGAPMTDGPAMLDADWSKAVRIGLVILGVGFGGFLAWAALAPLDEGVPASGVVAVESKHKRIDHLTGGRVEKILVKEGQRVRAGDDLIVLNEVEVKAALKAVESQWRVAAGTEARLKAEREGATSVSFPVGLREARDQEATNVMRAQSQLFHSRRSALEGELKMIRSSVQGLEAQMKSLRQLLAGRQRQVELFEEQLKAFRRLHADNFVSRNALLDMERQLAEVQSKQSEDLANIAAVEARLAEFRMREAQRKIEYQREVETQLADAQREAATLGERLVAQRELYARLAIRAPVDGVVVDLAANTPGGVIKPGDRIMDIVPEGDALIIDAQVAPQYIDRVHPGLEADVHFDAYMSRAERPVIHGKVSIVSADILTDPRTNTPYYAVRVTVLGSELKKLGALRLQPGMQGTVMVKTGERTLLTYLVRPLLRRFQGALTET
ncbi:MAG: HlyD family type I secretion periplasmic adaptor subunit [Rhodospirillaceae bacterium]